MVTVGHLHRQLAAVGIGGAAPFHAILVGDEAVLVKPQPAIEPVVIEKQQPRCPARRDLDIALKFIGRVTRNQQQRR